MFKLNKIAAAVALVAAASMPVTAFAAKEDQQARLGRTSIRINNLQNRIANNPNSPKLAKWQAALAKNQTHYDEVLENLEEKQGSK